MKRTTVILLAFIILVSFSLYILSKDDNKSAREVDSMKSNNSVSDGWTNYELLVQNLKDIEKKSNNNIDLKIIGKSHEDRNIYAVRVGKGENVLLITSEIHGNEKSGTEAILKILNNFLEKDETYKKIYQNITLVMVPKLNPDGSELIQRTNSLTWKEAKKLYPQLKNVKRPAYYNKKEKGFDINRDFHPDLKYKLEPDDFPGSKSDPGYYLTNEARALRDLYIDLQKEFGKVDAYIDIHHMGKKKIEGTNHDITIAIDYPPLGPDRNHKYINDWPNYDPNLSKKYALAAAKGAMINEEDARGVVRYTHSKVRDKPGQARSAFALNGSATVLFEIPGKEPDYGYDKRQINLVVNAIMGVAKHMVDDTIDELDPDEFYDLPKYWSDTPKPTKPLQFTTDFTEYNINETPNDWTHLWLGNSDEWTIKDNPRRLEHISGSGRRGLTINQVGDVYGDVEIFAIVRGRNVLNTLFQIGFHRSGYSGNENSIIVDARVSHANTSKNSLRLLEWRGGKTKVFAKQKLPFEVQENTWYRVLLQRSGEGVKAKMWPDGEDEPDWQIVSNNNNLYGGKVGISHFTPGTINDFAYISVGTGGKEAIHAPKEILNN